MPLYIPAIPGCHTPGHEFVVADGQKAVPTEERKGAQFGKRPLQLRRHRLKPCYQTQHKRTQAADLKRHCEHSFLPRLIETLEVEGISRWPYRQRWGYYPSGGLGLVVLILVILLLLGRI